MEGTALSAGWAGEQRAQGPFGALETQLAQLREQRELGQCPAAARGGLLPDPPPYPPCYLTHHAPTRPTRPALRKGTFEDMFLRLLQDEGEEWALFFAYRGELPSEEELAQFQGFVITGSVCVPKGTGRGRGLPAAVLLSPPACSPAPRSGSSRGL